MLKVVLVLAGIILILIACILIESKREFGKLEVTEYNLSIPKLPDGFLGYRIVMLCDLHGCCIGEDNTRLIEMVHKNDPDVIFIVGDMITCPRDEHRFSLKYKRQNHKTAELINTLSKTYPVYYSFGNHEKGMQEKSEELRALWEEYRNELSDRVVFLENKRISLKKGDSEIFVYGLDIDREYYRRFVKKGLGREKITDMLGVARKSSVNILLAHNPDYFEDYEKWGADLVFSGHNHGGLIRFPVFGGVISPRLRIFPKYDSGSFRLNDSTMLLSRGLGGHSIKIRVNNVPEIIVITMNR